MSKPHWETISRNLAIMQTSNLSRREQNLKQNKEWDQQMDTEIDRRVAYLQATRLLFHLVPGAHQVAPYDLRAYNLWTVRSL